MLKRSFSPIVWKRRNADFEICSGEDTHHLNQAF